MMIFPLSPAGKVVLILIAIVLGCICWALWFPESFKKLIGKGKKQE